MLRDGLIDLARLWREVADSSFEFEAEVAFFRLEFPRRLIGLVGGAVAGAPAAADMQPARFTTQAYRDVALRGLGPRVVDGQLSGAAVTIGVVTPAADQAPAFDVRYVFSQDLRTVVLGLFSRPPSGVTSADLRSYVRSTREYIRSGYRRPVAEVDDHIADRASGLSSYFARRAIQTRSYELEALPPESELLNHLRESITLLSWISIETRRAAVEGLQGWVGPTISAFVVESTLAQSPRLVRSSTNGGKQIGVWFGTNRQPVFTDDEKLHVGCADGPFSGEDAERLFYGTCTVSIPKSHRFGGSRTWFEGLLPSRERLDLIDVSGPLLREEFVDDIRKTLMDVAEQDRQVLVYIHGYNITFREAAIRAAQLGADLNVAVPAFYSWPSVGRTLAYVADSAAIDASEPRLVEFLETMTQLADSSHIHLLVHSMGNKAMIRIIDHLVQHCQKRRVRFGQVILAAPDVDSRVFRQRASVYSQLCSRATLYVSREDQALRVSKTINNFHRAGLCPPVTVVPGLDTIDVSSVDVSLLGHGYYGRAHAVLYDMADLLNRGVPPSRRIRLDPIPDEISPDYWQIRK